MSIHTKRRVFLKGSLAAGAVGVAVGAGLLHPRSVLAAWPKEAFAAKELSASLTALLGSDKTEESADIKIKAPDIAENGAVVPVTVESDVEGAKSISIIASGNGTPLVASFQLGESAAHNPRQQGPVFELVDDEASRRTCPAASRPANALTRKARRR